MGLVFAVALITSSAHAAVTNVAWYRLGENDPGARSESAVTNTTTDFVGVKHLMQFGDPLYSSPVSTRAASAVGSVLAVEFNGSNQYFSNAVVSTAVDNFGLEAWVKPSTTVAGNRFIACNGSTLASGWAIFQKSASYTATFGGVTSFGTAPAVAGTWTHLALVRDNGATTFYVDGVVSGTSSGVPISPATGFTVGTRPQASAGQLFNGAIDEVRVFTFAAGQFSTNDLLFNLQRVATLPATAITLSNATLNGSANPAGLPASAWFEWGTTTNYGNVTPAQAFGSGSTNFSQIIAALAAATPYHFRAVASNSLGTVRGANQSFTTPLFTDIGAGLPGVSLSSVAWGDYDNDGRLDILLAGSTGPFVQTNFISQIWRNNGSGFTNINAGLTGLTIAAVAWGDYNNDGRLDILMGGTDIATTNLNSLDIISEVRQNSNGNFIITATNVSPIWFGSVAWGDYDNDGRPDILLTGGGESGNLSEVWRNTGNGFTNINAGLLGLSHSSVAWGDYDNDGRLDILLTGEIGSTPGSQLWRNTGNGFTNINAGLPGVRRGSVAWGDYDNDGRLDILLSGLGVGNVCITEILRNTGTGFTNINAGLPGVRNGSVAWGDVDNDGRPDILLTGALTTNTQTGFISQIWRNTVNGFTNLNLNLPGVGLSSAALGDYDNDGRLDLLLTGATSLDMNGLPTASISQIWRNNLPLTNTPPAAPTVLTATYAGTRVSLNWNAGSDAQTIASGLSYNVRVGTTPGGSNVLSAMALPNGLRLLPALGNAQSRTNIVFEGQYGGSYYWSVQAVDPGLAGSPFAAEQQIIIPPLLVQPLRLGNGVFQFWITNFSSDTYGVLGTTNLSLPVTNWQFLGLPVSLGGGLHQFNDSLAPTYPQRYYLLRKE